MNRNLLVTINSYPNFEFNKQSIESFRFAANKWGCDFYEKTYSENNGLPGKRYIWDKFWILNNFTNYDNVLYIDADCIINTKSSSIFDEIDDENDFYVVLDGNPGRFENDFYKNIYSKNFSNKSNEHVLFEKMFDGFNIEDYLKNYFNAGMMLFKPKKIKKYIEQLNSFVITDEVLNYFNNDGEDQNLLNAWILNTDIKIKILNNKWNWIAPDIHDEYEMFLGEMKPNIYHFCGTNLSKERLTTYDRWK